MKERHRADLLCDFESRGKQRRKFKLVGKRFIFVFEEVFLSGWLDGWLTNWLADWMSERVSE